jgi:hypothetical protein
MKQLLGVQFQDKRVLSKYRGRSTALELVNITDPEDNSDSASGLEASDV